MLGRDPNLYADGPQDNVRMSRLTSQGRTIEDELDSMDADDRAAEQQQNTLDSARQEAERQALEVVTNGGWRRGGASGMLRQGSSRSTRSSQMSPQFQDDGVD